MFKVINLACLVCLFMVNCVTHAGISNDVPSCYEANKVVKTASPKLEVLLLIDQTTPFDANIKNSIVDTFKEKLKPGTSFVISTFSSFNQSKYTEIIATGLLEEDLESAQRDSTSVKLLKSFDACMRSQNRYVVNLIKTSLTKAFSVNSTELAKSDVIASLRDLSARVKQSKAKEKIVIVASDMLENSSISSFYLKQNLRVINPEEELKKVKNVDLYGDFGGARVYIIGGGLVSEDPKRTPTEQYRGQQIMQPLVTFWRTWFTNSKATLVEFGQPLLLSPIE